MNDEEYQQAIQAGQLAYQNEEWQVAIDTLVPAFAQNPTIQIQKILGVSFAQLENFVDAWSYLQYAPQAYQESLEQAQFYLTVALKNTYFLAAREFALATAWNATLVAQIVTAEQAFRNSEVERLNTQARRFYHLSNYSLGEQNKILQQAEHLPLHEYVASAQFLLIDPFLSAMTRNTILNRLRELVVHKELAFHWLDGRQLQVRPDTLPAVEAMPIYQTLTQGLNQLENRQDPLVSQILQEQLRLEMFLTYPFSPLTTVDSESWFDNELAVLHQSTGRSESSAQSEYHELLRTEVQTLFNAVN